MSAGAPTSSGAEQPPSGRRRTGGAGQPPAGAGDAPSPRPAAKQAAKRPSKPASRPSVKPAAKPAAKPAGRRAAAPASKRAPRASLQRVDETSAGGLVVDLAGDIPHGALIGRTDRRGRLRWSLPKGHLEAGETAQQAAVREVAEETGIQGEIFGELGTIDYWFVADGRRIHKTVHHYLLRATGGELSDADVEVTEVAWVPLPDISRRLAYPDERNLVKGADRLIAESA